MATEQLGEFGKLCAPGQFRQNAAQENEPNDVSDRRQGRDPRTHHGHPAQDVRITPQLIESGNLGMVGAEIHEEVAGRATVLTYRAGSQCGAQRIDGALRTDGPRDAAGEPGAKASRGYHRDRPDVLSDGAGILLVDVERSNVHVNERGLNVGVPHELHECRQADAGAQHIGGEGVTETVRVGAFHAGGLAMVAEQGA